MKKLLATIFALLLCLALTVPVFAESHPPRLVDNADLLTSSEETALMKYLDEISERQKVDIVIVTVESTGSKSPMQYADDYFDYNGYGFGENFDGILLLISMEERDWYISTCGFGITALTDARIDYIGDKMLDDLKDGDYYSAFRIFAEQCDIFITRAKSGDFSLPFNYGTALVFALFIGCLVSFIVTGVMKGQLKTVRSEKDADSYIKSGSMNITEARDLYLYRVVNRRPRPKDTDSGGSSVHSSSSGRSHGGGGGKF